MEGCLLLEKRDYQRYYGLTLFNMQLIFIMDATPTEQKYPIVHANKESQIYKMWVSESHCYAYECEQRKLDPGCEEGIVVCHSRNRPA